jgi:hypothetical protein
MQNSTEQAFRTFVPKPPKKRFLPKDTGTDRSRKYNATHSGINIGNNAMLDRYLKNRNELINLGVRVNG